MEYKLSKFVHIYKNNDKVCLYNALTMDTVYMHVNDFSPIENDLCSNNIENLTAEILHKLTENNIVVDGFLDEDFLLTKIKEKVFTGVNLRVMVLQMTDYCNLECKYCFIEGAYPDSYHKKMMTWDIAKKSIDRFVGFYKRSDMREKPSIVFYGGEPLVNWIVLKKCLSYMDEVNERDPDLNLGKVIITNGTLITDEIAEELKKHNVLVLVSIDGIKKVHDFNRIDHDKCGSFDRVVNGYNILINHRVETGVSCVLAPNGIDYAKESFEFLKNDLKIIGLGLNHVSIIPNLTYYDPKYEERYAEKLLEIQDIIQDKKLDIYERRMNHKINCFLHKQLIKSDCTGCGEQFSVNTDGSIGICQGYIGSGKTFNHNIQDDTYYPDEDPVFKEWSTRSPLNIEECQKCPALATCGGGCPRNGDMLNGTIWKPDTAFCHFALKAQEWLIWRNNSDES